MENKCSKCGAPLENGVCTYCGNVEVQQMDNIYQDGAEVNRNYAGQAPEGNTYQGRTTKGK